MQKLISSIIFVFKRSIIDMHEVKYEESRNEFTNIYTDTFFQCKIVYFVQNNLTGENITNLQIID